jgi:hypothetical protein
VQDGAKLPRPGAAGADAARHKNKRAELTRELLETAARGEDTRALLDQFPPHELHRLAGALEKLLEGKT